MPGLIDEYRLLHQAGKFDGHSMLPHRDAVAALVKRFDAKTLLDYGCGKGHQYTRWRAHETWGGIMPTLYDPGVPEFSVKPTGKFDGVICTDVAEHIEPDDVFGFLDEVFGYAEKFVFWNISCKPAVKNLPISGRNCHTLIQPPEWWTAMLSRHARGVHWEVAFTE